MAQILQMQFTINPPTKPNPNLKKALLPAEGTLESSNKTNDYVHKPRLLHTLGFVSLQSFPPLLTKLLQYLNLSEFN